MPHVYQRTPFNTTLPVYVVGNVCRSGHEGARDLGFITIQWQTMRAVNRVVQFGNDGRILYDGTGSSVFAVEAGTVVYVNRDTTCYDNRRDIVNQGLGECQEAHSIVVRGNDGFFTEYAHVTPNNNINVGSVVQQGTPLGNIDNSGSTSGPHLHFTRWNPNPGWNPSPNNPFGWNQNGGTCDWTMNGLVPPNRNGWVLYNGSWYFFDNGKQRRGGWVQVGDTSYQLNSETGAWTNWVLFQNRYWFFNGNDFVLSNTPPPNA